MDSLIRFTPLNSYMGFDEIWLVFPKDGPLVYRFRYLNHLIVSYRFDETCTELLLTLRPWVRPKSSEPKEELLPLSDNDFNRLKEFFTYWENFVAKYSGTIGGC